MQSLFVFACVTVLVMMMTTPATAAPAPPSSVFLYPSGARIQVATQTKMVDGHISFELPPSARIETLAISVEDGMVSGLTTSPAPIQPDSPAMAAIRKRLNQARAAAAVINGEMAAINARIRLWTEPPQFTDMENMERLDAIIPQRLRQLYGEAAALGPQQTAARREVARLERELIAAGGETDSAPMKDGKTPPPAQHEAVQIRAAVRLHGKNTGEGLVTVRYSYTLADCGWSPVYMLDAQPDRERVVFMQEAEIRQASGLDWNDVPITLASADLGSGLEPAPLGTWHLRPAPVVVPRAASRADNAAIPEGMVLMKSASASGVRQLETPAATVWELGRQTVPAGVNVRLPLTDGNWKATFVRVARPARQKTAYLMADVMLPEPVVFPSGTAQYLVDGIATGSGSFAMTGTTDKIYFGSDPRVTAEMKLDTRQSGSSGFVGKRQTRSWNWTITVSNHHATPVLVQVQDPEPQAGDKAIEIRTSASPGPHTEHHVNIWELTVPARNKSIINYRVDVSAPADMRLIDGR